MVVDAAQRWALTLVRGLLCVWLALTFMTLPLDERPPSATQDEVSDDAHDSLDSWLGRGGPRIIKRLVGTEHWAINAVIPDELLVASTPIDVGPVLASRAPCSLERRVAPARGPPRPFTI